MKVLLLTDVPPCTNYTAGIFLEQMLSFLPVKDVACFAVINPSIDPIYPASLEKMVLQKANKPREDWGNSLGKFGNYRSFVMENIIKWRDIPSLVNSVANFAGSVKADMVWCVLQGQTMIRLARPVAKKLNLPLLTSIWDPPGWWMRANKVHPTIGQQVMAEFGEAIQASVSTGTASWAMAKEYEQRYSAKTTPFLPSLPLELALPPAAGPSSAKELIIGMAGQLYAQNEWNALVQALMTVDSKIAGRQVRFRLLGRGFDLGANNKMFVEYLGWHSQAETIKLLSEADILYCPYWFDLVFREESRLSFPSKLTSYLATGRAVMFHGPEYASPGIFLKEWSAGECCYSLETDAIITSLTKLATDEAFYQETVQNGAKAFVECLTMPVLRKNFLEFLDKACT